MKRISKKGLILFSITVALASMTACTIVNASKSTKIKQNIEENQVIEESQIPRESQVLKVEESTIQASHLSAKKVTETITFKDVDKDGYIKVKDSVNVRTQPSTNASVETKLRLGAKVRVTGEHKDWKRVRIDGKTLYIASQYVVDKMPETPAPTTQAATTVADANHNAEASGSIGLNSGWNYASFSKINSGTAKLYKASSNRKGITICVNAGHGTKGGSSVKTQCHPDGTPKVTGGTTSAGATHAVAVSSGTTMLDGTSEAAVTLKMAKAFKEELLSRGYDVLMIRETEDVQLDNIARTVIANNTSSCHIALHWDSTTSNKGAFYMKVPNVASYKAMEPVASNWKKHDALGESLVAGLRGVGVKIFSSGSMEMDLTQTSYSTIPSIDIELGDRASDHSAGTISTLAKGLADGVNAYFGQ